MALYSAPSTDPTADDPELAGLPWYRQLNSYHWFVFVVAALGWLFDTMDQQLFTLARLPAMRELVKQVEGQTTAEWEAVVKKAGADATSIFLIGWAAGGLVFGVLGDRIGRVKTMLMTILIYSIFTGVSAFSTGFWDFAFWRFVTGLGVGGEFAVGVALVAEVMPERARSHAIGLLQALSAVGNITAALIAMAGTQWRTMFLIGTAPALLSLVVRYKLKEPERWKAVSASEGVQKQLGSYAALFGDPVLRRHALLGLCLACAGVIGLWGIGFFTVDLLDAVFTPGFKQQGLEGEELRRKVGEWKGYASLMQNLGGFFGIFMFSHLSQRIGRRPTFAFCFVTAAASTAFVFGYLGKIGGVSDVFWMVPLMGFCQLSLFGGYAVYLPELFPTRLRSTGTSFCYNVGRFVAAVGPMALGLLITEVYSDRPEPMRPAGVTMCVIFLLGLIVVPLLPETKGKPLPE